MNRCCNRLWAGVLLVSSFAIFAARAAEPPPPETPQAATGGAPPAFTDLILTVWQQRPAVQAAQAALDAAGYQYEAAGQPLYNPELEADWEAAETETAFVGIRQTIDWADKRGARARVGGLEREAAAAALADVRQQVAVEVGAALAGLHLAQESRRVGSTRTGLMEDFAKLAEQRHRSGDIGTADLQLARIALSRAQLELVAAEGAIVDARRALVEAAGLTPASWPPMPETLPAAPAPIADPDSLLERLPELRALRAEAEAARAGITLAERQRRPDPTVVLRGGQEGSDALVGVNVSVPLFIRNTYRAEVNAASSLSVSLEKQLLDAFVAAKARHSAAAETYARLREALRAWEAGGQLALNRRLEILKELWESGELSASEYLIQTRESLDAELSALEVKRRAWESWFEWLDASAGVNTWLGISEEEAPR